MNIEKDKDRMRRHRQLIDLFSITYQPFEGYLQLEMVRIWAGGRERNKGLVWGCRRGGIIPFPKVFVYKCL